MEMLYDSVALGGMCPLILTGMFGCFYPILTDG